MNNHFKRILTCTMAAVIISAASAMPVNTVTAYAPKPDTVFVAAESISINRTEITIGKGESYNLNSTVYPADVSNKSVLWLTSNPNVAYVDGSGKVIAKGTGNATISAVTHNGRKSLCYVTVNEAPSKVTLNCHNMEVGIG